MEQQQWSEWIEWKGGECPIPHAKAGEWQFSADDFYLEEAASFASLVRPDFYRLNWLRTPGYWFITAYRVLLTAQQPTTESDRDIDIGDGVDEQRRMVERDEPAKAAQPVPGDPIEALWQAIGTYSVQVSETGECAPPAELLAAVEAIRQALTPPAPAKPEPKTADFSAVAPMERLGATRWGAE